jgi:hypothetical protein
MGYRTMNILEEISPLVSHAMFDLIETLEHSFESVNYATHLDDITHALDSPLTITGSANDTAHGIYDVYRHHANWVLSSQGVHLKNPYQIQFNLLVTITEKVCLLGTSPYEDLLAVGITAEDNEDSSIYVANILHLLTEISVEQLLTEIEYINPDILVFLQKKKLGENLITGIAEHALSRVKSKITGKDKAMTQLFRGMDHLGYDLSFFIERHAEHLDLTISPTEMAEEIELLVLGSSVSDDHVIAAMLTISEQLIEDPRKLLAVNSAISKLQFTGL